MNSFVLSALITFNTCLPSDLQIEQWAIESNIPIEDTTLANMKLGAMDACLEFQQEEIAKLSLRDQASFVVQTSLDHKISIRRVLLRSNASDAVKEEVSALLEERAADTAAEEPAK